MEVFFYSCFWLPPVEVFSWRALKCFRMCVCVLAVCLEHITVRKERKKCVFCRTKIQTWHQAGFSRLLAVCWISLPVFLLLCLRRKYPTDPYTESRPIKKIGWKMLLEACKIPSHKHNYIWHIRLHESHDYLLVHHMKSFVLVFQASKGSTLHYLRNFVQKYSPNFRGF